MRITNEKKFEKLERVEEGMVMKKRLERMLRRAIMNLEEIKE